MACLDENTIAEFVQGALPVAAATAVEDHVGSCASCRTLLSELAKLAPMAGNDEPAPAAVSFGRYVVQGRLGAGGMGVVFAAHDPELDRRVALKLLRPDVANGTERRARLLREAQLMARLAHPNVCAVFDVGTFGDRLFVTMELITGQTLREWLRERRRSWPEIRDTFVQAGRGLAAAHELGITHRDFKPDNVLVGENGRVCVTDFGLARLEDDPAPADGAPRLGQGSPAMAWTRTGEVLGTPAYMSPEQQDGRPVGPESDQYSFCVALHEALYGKLPPVEGWAPEPPAGVHVPSWLRRAVVRGLAPAPAERHASIAALLDALTADRLRRRWVPAAVVAAVAVLCVGGVSLVLLARQADADDRAAACAVGPGELAAVWDAERRRTLHDAFFATGAPFAAASFATVENQLDAWASAWAAMRRDACLANASGRQSSTMMDLRLACLDGRREEVRALGDILSHSDAHTLDKAVAAAFGLTPVAACADTGALITRPPPPIDPDARTEFHALQKDLARATVLEHAGRYTEGIEVAARVAARAKSSDVRAVLADSLVELGTLEERAGRAQDAEATLREAIRAAEAARTDDALAGARLELLWVVCVSQARYGELAALRADAEAAITRVGGDEPLVAELLHKVGAVELDTGDLEAAQVSLERAAEIRTRRLGVHPSVASTLGILGHVYQAQGRADESERVLRRALDIRVTLLGDDHPDVGDTLTGLGNLARQRGAPADALALHERALANYEKALGPDHPNVASALGNTAGSLSDLGRHDEAIARATRAVAILDRPGAPPTPLIALVHRQLASVYGNAGHYEEVIVHLQRALAVVELTAGADHVDYAFGLLGLGDAALALGKVRDARAAHARALTIAEARLGADNPRLAGFLAHLAFDHATGDRPADSVPLLERTLALQASAEGAAAAGIDPYDLAETRFLLAVVLAERGRAGDHARAVALGRQAADGYAAVGRPVAERRLAHARAWLAAQD